MKPTTEIPEHCEKLAFRINDACRASGLSRSSLYKAIAEGRLRSVRVAGRRLIPANALRAFLGVEATP